MAWLHVPTGALAPRAAWGQGRFKGEVAWCRSREATEASQAPKNLKHLVIDNQVYQTVGAVPMVNQGRTDYAAIAKGAGIARTRTIDALDQLEREMPRIAREEGPSFTVLRVEPETGFLRTPPMTYEGPEMKYRFGRALEKRFGIKVFGPQGY